MLGPGSPTYPLGDESYPAWTVTCQWENLYGHDLLYAGPLFIEYSHAWIANRVRRRPDTWKREADDGDA